MRTISTSSGLGPLQMVSEPDTGQCASEEVVPRRGVDTRRCTSGGPTSIGERNECQRGRWALKGVDCVIPHWLGRRTKHPLEGCENLSLANAF